LHDSVSYVAGSASPQATLVANSLFWDLGNLPRGASGSVIYQVKVNANASNGLAFNNYAQILSAEDDANYADNVSKVTTTVVFDRPPLANADSYSVNEDGVLSVLPPGVLANDLDPEGDAMRAILAHGPAHGALSVTPDGGFIYLPAPNFNGSDSFTYKANDGMTDSLPATVTITIVPVNDPPSFTKGPNELVDEDAGPQTLPNWATNLSAGPPDEAEQTLNFIVTNNTDALFSAPPAIGPNGTLTYTRAPHAC